VPTIMPAAIRRLYYGWVVLAACLAVGVVCWGVRFSFGVFFKSLEEEFVWTRALTSSVFSVYLLLGCGFAVLGGWALDRYGPKIVIAVMGFFTGLGLLLTSQANAPWHLFVSYSLLLAIGTAPIWTVVVATASRWFTERRGLAIGIVTSGNGIGMVTIAPIAAYIISGYGWRTAYFIMALMAFVIIIPCAFLLKKAPSEPAALPENSDATKPGAHESQGLSLLTAARTKNLWLILSIQFLQAFCIFLVMTHIVPHAIDLGITATQAASILSLIGGTIILGRISIGRVSDSIGRKRAVMICTLLMTGAMMWLIGSSNLWMLYLFAIVFGFAYGGSSPPIYTLAADIFGLRYIGVIMAVLGTGWFAGGAIGPAFAGYVFDISGSYTPAFLAGMTAMLLVAVLILPLGTPSSYNKR